MKKSLFYLLLLTVFGLVISCNKDDNDLSRDEIVGKWTSNSGDCLYFDEQRIPCDIATDYFYYWSVDNIQTMTPQSYEFSLIFNDDGSLIMNENGDIGTYKWSYAGNNIILIEKPDFFTIQITDGYIDILVDTVDDILGYYYSETYVNPDDIDEWYGYDGNLHMINAILRLSKE